MRNKLHVKATALATAIAASLILSGCGGDNPTMPSAPHTPNVTQSSASPSPTELPSIGTGVQISPEPNGSLNYYVEDPAGGIAKGTVNITVGEWTYETTVMSGYAEPVVNPGNYTAEITYTDPEGGVITGSTSYTLSPVDYVKMAPMTTKGPLGQGWVATVEVIGNPIVTGTVSFVLPDGTVLASGEVAQTEEGKNVASINMPAKDEFFMERVVVKYSGDTYNPEGEGSATIMYGNQ